VDRSKGNSRHFDGSASLCKAGAGGWHLQSPVLSIMSGRQICSKSGAKFHLEVVPSIARSRSTFGARSTASLQCELGNFKIVIIAMMDAHEGKAETPHSMTSSVESAASRRAHSPAIVLGVRVLRGGRCHVVGEIEPPLDAVEPTINVIEPLLKGGVIQFDAGDLRSDGLHGFWVNFPESRTIIR
jgi:hypothetical protein